MKTEDVLAEDIWFSHQSLVLLVSSVWFNARSGFLSGWGKKALTVCCLQHWGRMGDGVAFFFFKDQLSELVTFAFLGSSHKFHSKWQVNVRAVEMGDCCCFMIHTQREIMLEYKEWWLFCSLNILLLSFTVTENLCIETPCESGVWRREVYFYHFVSGLHEDIFDKLLEKHSTEYSENSMF